MGIHIWGRRIGRRLASAARSSGVALALTAAAPVFPAYGGTQAVVTVFAAASLREALGAAVNAFEAKSGARVVVSYAATSALARQIERGAPADVFISADRMWMDYLADRRLIRPGSRRDLLTNRLALIAPAGSRVALDIRPGFPLARALGKGRLAMADVDAVPAGRYGRAALEALGVWQAVEPRVARAANVRAALAYVARAEAPLGIVYRTDAMAEPKVRIVGLFPEARHPPIVYPAAIVASSGSAAAPDFLDYLESPRVRAIWRSHGFGVAR